MLKFSDAKIQEELSKLENWNLKDGFLHKDFVFNDFKQTLEVMNKIGSVAEELNHHPEWCNVYNKLSINLSTHDANGITVKDFNLAVKIDLIVKDLKKS